jgi:hypothetical protein
MVAENDNAARGQGGCSSSGFRIQQECLIIRISFLTASFEDKCQIISVRDKSHTKLLKIDE